MILAKHRFWKTKPKGKLQVCTPGPTRMGWLTQCIRQKSCFTLSILDVVREDEPPESRTSFVEDKRQGRPSPRQNQVCGGQGPRAGPQGQKQVSPLTASKGIFPGQNPDFQLAVLGLTVPPEWSLPPSCPADQGGVCTSLLCLFFHSVHTHVAVTLTIFLFFQCTLSFYGQVTGL